ncbi:hypothetical protein [uncultured Paraglaciecola sp.]|uniref:hypothetical protein n=1 Tax=uncultured Paraglaciecola sp. TaxID=1765024 RepID=UPI00263208B9|nr:hypothetical protein [uncultured Paraglaciecola sp.]
MDVIDDAQQRTQHFQDLAMQNRAFDLAPVAAKNTDSQGNPLCIDCDTNITRRREVLPSTQRCIECQTDHEKRSRN